MSALRFFALLLPPLAVSCQTKPYAPPPQAAFVESVEVQVGQFAGRPEAYALVRGRLSSPAAQLVESRQSRQDRQLVLEVLEQTPRGAELLGQLGESPPFETRIPVEILGLDPGPAVLHANGHAVEFEIPPLQAEPADFAGPAAPAPRIALVDEFLPATAASPGAASPGAASPGAANLRGLRFRGAALGHADEAR